MAARPGYDFLIQSESGLMAITGEPNGEPMKLGVAITDIVAGMYATQAVLAALIARGTTGAGQMIDMALLDGAVASLANVGSAYLNTRQPSARHGNAHASIVPYELFHAADGPIAVGVGNDAQFRRLCVEVLASPDLGGGRALRHQYRPGGPIASSWCRASTTPSRLAPGGNGWPN